MFTAELRSLTRKEDSLLADIAFGFVELEFFQFCRSVRGDKRLYLEIDSFPWPGKRGANFSNHYTNMRMTPFAVLDVVRSCLRPATGNRLANFELAGTG